MTYHAGPFWKTEYLRIRTETTKPKDSKRLSKHLKPSIGLEEDFVVPTGRGEGALNILGNASFLVRLHLLVVYSIQVGLFF